MCHCVKSHSCKSLQQVLVFAADLLLQSAVAVHDCAKPQDRVLWVRQPTAAASAVPATTTSPTCYLPTSQRDCASQAEPASSLRLWQQVFERYLPTTQRDCASEPEPASSLRLWQQVLEPGSAGVSAVQQC